MNKRHASSFMLLALLPFLAAGCKKKQAKVIPAPPTLTEMALLSPLPPLVILVMQPEVLPPSATIVEVQPPPPKKKPKRNTRKPAPIPQPPVQTAQNTPPPRITIDRPPVTGEGAGGIFVGLEHSEEAHHKLSTAQLLQSTEDNLKSITRTLDADEQATVAQIRNFMTQSRTAITDNDLVRAHNLALKAHLLSDELVKR
jgi:hypothetical protein